MEIFHCKTTDYMNIGIYTITSQLHDKEAVDTISRDFVGKIEEATGEKFFFHGDDFTAFGSHGLDLIYVRTGGTEGLFRELFPSVVKRAKGKIYLLTSGHSNSLAASMEILAFLGQNDVRGEIIHGDIRYIAERIKTLEAVGKARRRLSSTRLGVLGKPSDWLIASGADYGKISSSTGISIEDIPIEEVIAEISETDHSGDDCVVKAISGLSPCGMKDFGGALRIYGALKEIIRRHSLDGITIRCFDLLGPVCNTACLSLALLNSEGIPAGCEGDIPSLLSMTLASALTGQSGFQANPSRIDPMTGEILFAHCTVPLNMLRCYSYDTHFESGIGVAVAGEIAEGDVTVFKVSGDLTRSFIAEGCLVRNQHEENLCRTQIVVRAEGAAEYFLNRPIGNHHIILQGHHRAILCEFLEGV